VQGLAKGMGIKQKIISPTFILMRNYKGKVNLSHLDLYRIEGNIQEVRNLGLFDIFKEKNNVTVIEWGEKIKNILPKNTLWIEFKDIDHETRKVIIR
jgi:tRNA threonylcarbamoyladenosine biosynthesis protein TsaE